MRQAANPNWWQNGIVLYFVCLCISGECQQKNYVNTLNEVIGQKSQNIYLEFGQILRFE